MNQADIALLKENGWTVDCESPFELSHFEGSSATGMAANLVLSTLQEENRLLYSEVVKAVEDWPTTWYPALLGILVRAAYKKHVFKPGGALTVVQNVEADLFKTTPVEKKGKAR